jgi:MYXO-CTERM domain-containing protein
MKRFSFCAFVAAGVLALVPQAWGKQESYLTDADAFVWSDSWGPPGNWDVNTGTDTLLGVMMGDNTFKTYLHFNLAPLDARLKVVSATLKLDYAYGDTGGFINIYSIMDETKDWNLATLGETAITYRNAPQNDLSGDPEHPTYTEFLEMGTDPSSVTRRLGTVANVAISQDVAALVRWLRGYNAGFSTFSDTDDKVTFALAETLVYPYANYYSKEYTPTDGSDAPRIDVAAFLEGDSNMDDSVNFTDYQILERNFGLTGSWAEGDCNFDGAVNFTDYQALERDFGQSVPEPGGLALLALGGLAALRRRRS